MIDLAEQTRLLGELPQELEVLAGAIDTVRAGEISRPVREIVPIAVRAHDLSIRCLKQLDTLAGSQYAVMKDGHENLAFVAEATVRVSLVSTLCSYGITGRTEALLYEGTDETPETSRGYLAEANEELRQAAGTYRVLAQNLSRRLASAAARAEDQRRIERALARRGPAPETPAHSPSPASGRCR
ncbi:hypothetical protein ABZX98_07520 [Streptomyces sp. NPDC002992]|uniref:hypothetical protein n=1 Tax=Streptomyces sp. NPDC002992 TaxID=3154273 RepID=UPI0033BDBD30